MPGDNKCRALGVLLIPKEKPFPCSLCMCWAPCQNQHLFHLPLPAPSVTKMDFSAECGDSSLAQCWSRGEASLGTSAGVTGAAVLSLWPRRKLFTDGIEEVTRMRNTYLGKREKHVQIALNENQTPARCLDPHVKVTHQNSGAKEVAAEMQAGVFPAGKAIIWIFQSRERGVR